MPKSIINSIFKEYAKIPGEAVPPVEDPKPPCVNPPINPPIGPQK